MVRGYFGANMKEGIWSKKARLEGCPRSFKQDQVLGRHNNAHLNNYFRGVTPTSRNTAIQGSIGSDLLKGVINS